MFFQKSKQGFYTTHLEEYMQKVRSGERSYLPYVFGVFGEQDKASQRIAAQFLDAELKKFSFDNIVRTDRQMREKTSIEWFISWGQIDPKAFLSLAISDDEKKAVLVFASFHPNGYLREKAVLLLAGCWRSLPFILLRMNDWVPQVRAAALKAFDCRMQKLAVGELQESLPYAEKLGKGSRAFHGSYIDRLYQLLLCPQNESELALGLSSGHPFTRLLCMKALLRMEKPDTDRILRCLAQERVPHLRWLIYEALLACEGSDRHKVMAQMLADPYARIKNHVLWLMYTNHEQNTHDVAVRYLTDKSASVRDLGRWVVRKYDPGYDFRAFYRQSMESQTYAAICGLGETGTAADADILRPYIDQERERVVRAAMRSLMRLAPERFGTLMAKLLGDSRKGVAKEAYMLLSAGRFTGLAEEIYQLFTDTTSGYIQKKCALLLFRCPKWEAVIYMLEALSSSDEEIREYALMNIEGWTAGFNRSFSAATAGQSQRIKELISRQENLLGPKRVQSLLFLEKLT